MTHVRGLLGTLLIAGAAFSFLGEAARADSCPDFSGRYTGTMTLSNSAGGPFPGYPETLEISQSRCSQISITEVSVGRNKKYPIMAAVRSDAPGYSEFDSGYFSNGRIYITRTSIFGDHPDAVYSGLIIVGKTEQGKLVVEELDNHAAEGKTWTLTFSERGRTELDSIGQ